MGIETKKSPDLEELGLKPVDVVNIGDDGEVRSLKLILNDEKGKEASSLAIFRDTKGDYNIIHRKTSDAYKGKGLASHQLKVAEEIIAKHLKRNSRIYIEAHQQSVMKWAEKNGYSFDKSPDFSKEEILYEQDGDVVYVERFKLVKELASENKEDDIGTSEVRESISKALL